MVLEGDKIGLRSGVWDVVVWILNCFCLSLIGILRGFFRKWEVLKLEEGFWEVIVCWDIIVVIFVKLIY